MFAAQAFQHVGFANNFNDAPWAMFSTGGGALPVGLYARTWDGTTTRDTAIAGFDPTQPHTYKIVWTPTTFDYYVDGTRSTQPRSRPRPRCRRRSATSIRGIR